MPYAPTARAIVQAILEWRGPAPTCKDAERARRACAAVLSAAPFRSTNHLEASLTMADAHAYAAGGMSPLILEQAAVAPDLDAPMDCACLARLVVALS